MPIKNGAPSTLIGRTLGKRYVVERVLGTGAMGTVYCARQTVLGGLVAIKVLHPQLATDPGLVQRFEREAFATSRLDHPNALRVLDFGEDGDLRYLVTEYVEAGDLLALMEAEWPFSDERIVAILSQVLSVLVAVHDVGIVHRDLKPENILVRTDKNDDGIRADIVKVCDFGIAKVGRQMLPRARSFAPRLTEEGVVMGTPDYMSPEQAQGHAVDGRSDLYSVGVVLYHLLAGQTPFTADSPVGIALQHISEVPLPPSHHRNVHLGLEAVCLRALSKRPEDRFQTAREMRKAIRDALTTSSTALALVSVPATALQAGSTFSTSRPAVLSLREDIDRHRSRERRRRSLLAYAAVASVAITASAFVASRSSSAIDPIERAYHFPGGDLPSPAAEPGTASEPSLATASAIAISDSPPAWLPRVDPTKIEPLPIEPPHRPVTRVRQPSSAKPPVQRSLVALSLQPSPIPAVSPASTDAHLIRSEPWHTSPAAPESPSPVALQPSSSERREAVEPRPSKVSDAAPTTQNVQSPSPRPQAPSASVGTDHVSVGVTSIATSPGISGAKVKVGLSHVPLLACYQQALHSRPSVGPLEAQLRLTIDVGGRVVAAVLSRDGDLPGLRGCIEAAARGARVQGVDTGDGSATVQVRFTPR